MKIVSLVPDVATYGCSMNQYLALSWSKVPSFATEFNYLGSDLAWLLSFGIFNAVTNSKLISFNLVKLCDKTCNFLFVLVFIYCIKLKI